MLTGRLYVRNRVPPRQHNEQVPPALDAAVMRLLEEKPSDRYQSADELLRDLGRIKNQEVVGQLQIVMGRLSPRRLMSAALFIVALLILAGVYRMSDALARIQLLPRQTIVVSVVISPAPGATDARSGLPLETPGITTWPPTVTGIPTITPTVTATPEDPTKQNLMKRRCSGVVR